MHTNNIVLSHEINYQNVSTPFAIIVRRAVQEYMQVSTQFYKF